MGYSCCQFRVGYHFVLQGAENHGQPDLFQIATRTGDDGTTGWATTRAYPNPPRAQAMGDVDELNSHRPVAVRRPSPRACESCWWTSSTSFSTWAGSCPSRLELLKPEALLAPDQALEDHNANLHGCRNSSCLLARVPPRRRTCAASVARRAERAVVALGAQETLNPTPRQYLNRFVRPDVRALARAQPPSPGRNGGRRRVLEE